MHNIFQFLLTILCLQHLLTEVYGFQRVGFALDVGAAYIILKPCELVQ
jgi:hypothetical protein